MSNKYCPVGEIKCGLFIEKYKNNPQCEDQLIENYEVCPWPSRQVRENNLSKIFGAIPDMPEYEKQNPYTDGYAAGFAACRERAVEEIDKLSVWSMLDGITPILVSKSDAIAVICKLEVPNE